MKRHPLADFYWYAKDHYKKSGDVMADLKKLASHYCGVDAKHISNMDVLMILVNVISTDAGQSLILNFVGRHHWSLKEDDPNAKVIFNAVIDYLLYIAKFAQIKDGDTVLIEMGEPNHSILGEKEK